MPVVRQMSELYLRGSLANITMKNLTDAEREHVASLVDTVCAHHEMQRHKIKVMKELAVTIGADYADDRDNAEADYKIAVWRGVVDLFYHRKYTFACRACNSATYLTKRGRPKSIDRVQTPCPNCGKIEVASPGDVQVLQDRLLAGDRFLTMEEFQASYADLPDGMEAPTCTATIDYVPGAKKYENPEAIVNDDRQLRKFFGEFVWNYFRQQINENRRQEHKKKPVSLTGSTDWLLVQELLSLCTQMEIDYNYCEKLEPTNGVYTIRLAGLTTPPEFTVEFAQLRRKGALYGVPIRTSENGIEVMVSPQAAPMPIHEVRDSHGKVNRWQIKVYRPEHVSVLDSFAGSNDGDQDSDFTISQIDYRTVGGHRMNLDDHVDTVDNTEVMASIRDALPEGDCQDVFDIFSGVGEKYLAFSERYGDGDPRINHVAEFLGITPRAVNNHKAAIKLHSLANNFIPQG